jgi:hypothetical protein
LIYGSEVDNQKILFLIGGGIYVAEKRQKKAHQPGGMPGAPNVVVALKRRLPDRSEFCKQKI